MDCTSNQIGQQVAHVEGVHHRLAGHQVVVGLQLDAGVVRLAGLHPLEQLVDLLPGVLQEPEVVVAG